MAKYSGEQIIIQKLKDLYSSYGYTSYKMSRFEEYDLYAENKDFLVSSNVITFTDTDARLMALKPDVTLSIVKAFRGSDLDVSRVSYNENVYRISSKSGTFREIMQSGVECLGALGVLELAEVALLAQESLKCISCDVVLSISHMGIVEAFLNKLTSAEVKTKALFYMQTRNISALEKLAIENTSDSFIIRKLKELLDLRGSNEEVLSKLENLEVDRASIEELKSVISVLDLSCTRIDFSVLGGMKYYNGITLRGYVKEVSQPVLSGGQYDKLLQRMGKNAKAIGFALYLDTLERLSEDRDEYDVDVLLYYDPSCSLDEVFREARKLRDQGKSVCIVKSIDSKLRYKEIVSLKGGCDA